MNLISTGKDFAWGTVVKEAAQRAKFAEARHPFVGETFCLGGEVSPSVQVFFQPITFTDVGPVVFLGVYLEVFESEWRDRLLRAGLPPDSQNPPFGLHDANVAVLRPRPWTPISASERDVAELRDWLERAFEYARRLPSSLDSFITAIETNRIADHNVEAYLGHPVKVRGLVQWLRRVHGVELGERLLPLLSDRTEPYDLKAMLDAD